MITHVCQHPGCGAPLKFRFLRLRYNCDYCGETSWWSGEKSDMYDIFYHNGTAYVCDKKRNIWWPYYHVQTFESLHNDVEELFDDVYNESLNNEVEIQKIDGRKIYIVTYGEN